MSPPLKPNQRRNRPSEIPWFTNDKSNLIKLSDFLKNKHELYFAKGQTPDGMKDQAGYQKPTKLNKTSSLLKVPQMVWLSAAFFSADLTENPTYFYYTGTQLYNSAHGTPEDSDPTWVGWWSDGVIKTAPTGGVGPDDGDTPTPEGGVYIQVYANFLGSTVLPIIPFLVQFNLGPINAQIQTVPNLDYNESLRLLTVFQNVKTTIEKLRPGLTFVDVVDWYRGTVNGQPGSGTIDNNPNFPSTGGSFTVAFYPWMVSPDPTEKFFGTNFMHVFAGRLVDQNGRVSQVDVIDGSAMRTPLPNKIYATYSTTYAPYSPLQDIMKPGQNLIVIPGSHLDPVTGKTYDYYWWLYPTPTTIMGFTDTVPENITISSDYIAAKARIVKNDPFFSNYSCYFFSFVPPDPQIPDPVPTPYFGPPEDAVQGLQSSRPDWSAANCDSLNQMGVDIANNNLRRRSAGLVEVMTIAANDLKKYGFNYNGATSLIDEQYLVQLIAKNFNFNPTTGEDLS